MRTFKTFITTLILSLIASTALFAQEALQPTGFVAHHSVVSAEQPTYRDTFSNAGYPAGRTFDMAIYKIKNSMKMRLLLEKVEGERVAISLLDEEGRILYSEGVEKKMKKYIRNFDFSRLRDGQYTLRVQNGKEEIRRTMNLSTIAIIHKPARTLIAIN